jgi:hypothetical protein
VGEMPAQFQEQVKWCSCLEDSGSRVYDLILGPVDNRVRLAVRLEEATGRLQEMQDEHQEAVLELGALQSSIARV